MESPRSLFAHRPHWAIRLGPAPFLPMSRRDMDDLGWDACDVILVTGDAYVDHPSFGMAVIGRLLEAQGFRVGILSQPDWTSVESFRALGRPTLYFGITAGNMDSMVNRYTADRKIRRDDAYTPGGEAGRRPDRAAIVYAQRCREAYRDVPVVLGGIEASLRRFAHYDYWSDTVRRSVLLDSKADILLYGNAERAVVALTHRLARGESVRAMGDLRGAVLALSEPLEDTPGRLSLLDASQLATTAPVLRGRPGETAVVRLPAFEAVRADPDQYLYASRLLHQESNPGCARALVQRHGERDLMVTPPPVPLSTADLDRVFELPYQRAPHPAYGGARIPAWEMIRHSVTIVRGCFGGCSFCAITGHEGKIIQSRSEESILREVEAVRDHVEGFTGVISDLGGPSANMWHLSCRDPAIQAVCRRWSCLHPDVCRNLVTDQGPLVNLYRKARALPGIRKIVISSGLRHDLALHSPAYMRELVTHHVGGYLKIAPEHTEPGPLRLMMKPGLAAFERFKAMFERFSKEAGKEQYLIPYFIAAHPGTTDQDMLNLALWLKRNNFRLDQVQTFLPTPMTPATAMYHAGGNPLAPVALGAIERVATAKGLRQRRLHKAFLRWHDPENWPLLREALRAMGRVDLIGPGRQNLVPAARPGFSRGPRPAEGTGGKAAAVSRAPERGSASPARPPRPGSGGAARKKPESANAASARPPSSGRKAAGDRKGLSSGRRPPRLPS
ncbi:YgiQ family radical SAM protein [Pararhodospirillum oryzae]|uniref:UPF0313 protein n=1 Tax=Pararhodospirillum oryzae TaxID=478448 RepID=A0A512H7R8_9PROT|nr:YgiQ family radical SAM protein [Pararhodospirillum oryzae]GEO81481.1 UPF0313 protein [Pararhodospirillum oryzae]